MKKTNAPMTYEVAEKLFDYVDCQIRRIGCDGSLKHTKAWLHRHFHDVEKEEDTIDYIRQHGGYCDCEVLFNVGDRCYWND